MACFQIQLQRDGIVVLYIPRAKEQGDIPLMGCVQDNPPGLRLAIQFGKVTVAKPIPLRRVVSNPVPQVVTGRHVL